MILGKDFFKTPLHFTTKEYIIRCTNSTISIHDMTNTNPGANFKKQNDIDQLPEWVSQFYHLRCEAENLQTIPPSPLDMQNTTFL